MQPKILWPNKKRFAFTIFDDTDRANLKDIQLVYQCLDDLGFKTTKSVWVTKGNKPHESSGVTCDDKNYDKLCCDILFQILYFLIPTTNLNIFYHHR